MPYIPFSEKFPHLKETRFLTVLDNAMLPLPPDVYELVETYCDDDDCDCRRVLLHVASEKHNKIVAVIGFGWENRKFYEKWLNENDAVIIDELIGPALNMASSQSKIAPQLLQVVKDRVLQDKSYVDRIKKHYQMFKKSLHEEKKHTTNVVAFSKIGRNELCFCGSGKKYKQCCLLKGQA